MTLMQQCNAAAFGNREPAEQWLVASTVGIWQVKVLMMLIRDHFTVGAFQSHTAAASSSNSSSITCCSRIEAFQ